jgi:hypothetical protein
MVTSSRWPLKAFIAFFRLDANVLGVTVNTFSALRGATVSSNAAKSPILNELVNFPSDIFDFILDCRFF